jgi:hypothetical protein
MESELKEMLASLERTGYCQWMKNEGVSHLSRRL